MPSSHKYSLASCFLDVRGGIKGVRLLCLGRQKQLEERAGPAQASGYSNSLVGGDRAPPRTTSIPKPQECRGLHSRDLRGAAGAAGG